MKKVIVVNKKGIIMSSKAKFLIIKIGNKEHRKLSKSFKVLDIEKTSIRDITGNENMHYVAPEIKEPKFSKETPLALQKIIIDAYLFQKENNGFLYTTMINLDDIWPALPQRTLDLRRVVNIANHFSAYQFTPIKLVYIDESTILVIEDGQHHAAAAKMLRIPKVPCAVLFGKTNEEIAEDFESQNDYTKPLNQIAKYDSGLQAKHADCIIMDNVCNLFRIKLAGNTNEYPKTIHSIRAIKRIVRDYGEDGLKFVFQLIIDAGWEKQTKAYEESALNIGYGALEVIRNNDGDFDYDKLIKELRKYNNVTECLDAMKKAIGTYSKEKHPESTPTIYLNKKYGK